MAVYALTSLSGSPGVTTLAIAWAYRSARPTLILEADPTGGSAILAGPFRGEHVHDTSVLLMAERNRSELAEWMWYHSIPLPETTDRRVLPAVAMPAQAKALNTTWSRIADAVKDFSSQSGTDVVVDVGRLGMVNSPRPLLNVADTTLILAPATLPGINTLAAGLGPLREALESQIDPDRMTVVPVRASAGIGRQRRTRKAVSAAQPWSDREIAQVIAPTRVLQPLPWSPDEATMYSHATVAPKDWPNSSYTRAVSALIDATENHIRRVQSAAGLTETGDQA